MIKYVISLLYFHFTFDYTKTKKMKAAVIYHKDSLPEYVDFPEPVVEDEEEILVRVKAVAIKHFDKGRASGSHYSADAPRESGRVTGGDGICLLDDGTRVYGLGVSGMLAEKATIHKDRMVKVPSALDDATAAALPNAVIGAAMGLRFKVDIRPGDVVLINGATGFTGRVAVQIAKLYGAKKVITTGRNASSLHDLVMLGADETISLLQDDEKITAKLKEIHADTPIDIVIDYLWGHTAEMILGCIKGNGRFTNRIRSVGAVTGDIVRLSAATLRSVNLQLTGSGLGAWSKQEVSQLLTEILPGMFQYAVEGKLTIQTITHKLENIAELWQLDVPNGKRLVVII
jgi:NADPH:quinone reductase-like Zn-dependent oxidoreductase